MTDRTFKNLIDAIQQLMPTAHHGEFAVTQKEYDQIQSFFKESQREIKMLQGYNLVIIKDTPIGAARRVPVQCRCKEPETKTASGDSDEIIHTPEKCFLRKKQQESECDGHNFEFGIIMPVFVRKMREVNAESFVGEIAPGSIRAMVPEPHLMREDALVICSFCGYSKRMRIEDKTSEYTAEDRKKTVAINEEFNRREEIEQGGYTQAIKDIIRLGYEKKELNIAIVVAFAQSRGIETK